MLDPCSRSSSVIPLLFHRQMSAIKQEGEKDSQISLHLPFQLTHENHKHHPCSHHLQYHYPQQNLPPLFEYKDSGPRRDGCTTSLGNDNRACRMRTASIHSQIAQLNTHYCVSSWNGAKDQRTEKNTFYSPSKILNWT